jgi:hypothetical protein
MTKTQNLFRALEDLDFDIVSNLVLRILHVNDSIRELCSL